MTLIEEQLPQDPLHAEVVLHVRKHLRASIKTRLPSAPAALPLLFGLSEEAGRALGVAAALSTPTPIRSFADQIAGVQTPPPSRVALLGLEGSHVEQCRRWLLDRKRNEAAFKGTVATDLRTLLVLSQAKDLATATAPSDDPVAGLVPVLIDGPTGTGKELVARAMHEIARREVGLTGDFHVIHVAGLPTDLVNDELFGHVAGAFTGARKEREGRLEAADGGTVLIDELGDVQGEAQVRLLRFLQDGVLSRYGENKERKVRVRVIAATWHDLDEEAKQHKFRLDLLHRIRAGWLRLPALKDRENAFHDVVPELLQRLGQRASPAIAPTARDALAFYDWPGNLRELTSVLRVAIASARGGTVRLEDLPPHLQSAYLAKPLYARAPGFLSEEVDEQPLDAESVRVRAAEVTKHLMALEPPASAGGLPEVLAFLDDVPDTSVGHVATVERLKHLVALTRDLGVLRQAAQVWARVATSPIPELVRGVVSETRSALATEITAKEHSQHECEAQLDLVSNPWARLHGDLSKLPMMDGREPTELRQSLIGILKLLKSAAPGFFEDFRTLVSAGGLDAVRAAAAVKFKELSADSDTVDVNHKAWTKDQWVGLLTEFRSRNAAGRALGVDPKTIRRYLKHFKIRERWGQPPPGGE